MPNMLRVGVGSAVGLNGGSLNLLTGERAIRVRVVLHVREHRLSTGTAARDTTPGAAPNDSAGARSSLLPIDSPVGGARTSACTTTSTRRRRRSSGSG